MSSQSYLFNPTERTLAAAGDGFSCPRLTTAGRTSLALTANDKGMMVYDTTLTTLCIWSGGAWEFVTDNSNGWVNVKDFGAVGDGVTDDTVAIQAAVDSQKPLYWGGYTYLITSTISRTSTADIYWEGGNATIIYGGAHTERAIFLAGGGIEVVINNITVDGSKLCNKCLEIDNNSDSYSNFTANNLFTNRAKRINTFSGGEGLLVRGSYNMVQINGGGASNCELPAGQGTVGVIGIGGISANWYSTTRFIKSMYMNGVRIEKIYSSDPAYQFDQDGVKYFTPTDGTRKVQSLLSVIACDFVNCYGRSIKTQCRDTVVQSSSFSRTEGLASSIGNGEIDAQTGNGNFRDLNFSYANGFQPDFCVGVAGSTGTPGIIVNGCSVVLDAATTLTSFAQVFPSGGTFARHLISNNKIYGKVQRFFNFLANGDKNYAEVSDNYVGEIVDGPTAQKALIYISASGLTVPRYAYVNAYGNVYDNTHLPALVRDIIPGVSMDSNLSAWNNYGFQVNDNSVSPNAGGLKTNAIARLGKMGSVLGNGLFQIENIDLAAGASTTVNLRNDSRATIVFISAQFGLTGYAIFASGSTGNTVINKGASFEIGNLADPGVGTFRVWTSATNQITILNTNASARSMALFAMALG